MEPRTLYDKIWADHLVDEQPGGTCLLEGCIPSKSLFREFIGESSYG